MLLDLSDGKGNSVDDNDTLDDELFMAVSSQNFLKDDKNAVNQVNARTDKF